MAIKKTNSASRLLIVLNSAHKSDEKIRTEEAWAKAFGLAADSPMRARAVSQRLLLLHDELDRVKAGLAKSDVDPDVYKRALVDVEAAIAPGALSTPWANHKSHLRPDVLVSLRYWSEFLPHEEEEVDAKDLADLLAEIEELEQSLESSGLPEHLKALIKRQLEGIRTALTNYRIVGVRALRDAAKAAVVEVVASQDELKAHKDTKEIGTFGRIIRRAGSIADGAIKGQKAIEAVTKLYGYIEDFLK